MSELTTKTTVYFDADDYRRLQAIAEAQGKPAAQLVREAVRSFVAANSPARPTSIGAGSSGKGDVAERAEELLRGMGHE
jgi:predicted transcriptional regulator